MWIGGVSRNQLLEVFEPQGSAFPIVVKQRNDLTGIPGGHEYSLIWKKDPRTESDLPSMVVVLASGGRNNFLAWAATYLPTVRPFTAFCRVLEAKEVATSLPDSEPSLQDIEECCLGLILGEAATYANGRFDPKQLTPASYARTYSFALSRSLAFGLPDWDEEISKNWLTLRRLTKQPKLNLEFSVLESVWIVLLSALSTGSPSLVPAASFRDARLVERRHSSTSSKISEYLLESVWVLISRGSLRNYEWQLLTRTFPDLKEALDEVKGPLEDRVRSLDRYLGLLGKSANRDPLTAAFMAGYLTSQVSPRSFDHNSLLLPHFPLLSSSLLWFGLSVGASKEAQLKKYSQGLGRRVLRDLLRSESLFDRPKCDVAITELEVLMRGEGSQATDLKSTVHGLLEVEIAPRITSLIRWPPLPDENRKPTAERQPDQNLRSALTDLSQAIEKAEGVREKLTTYLNGSQDKETLEKKRKRR